MGISSHYEIDKITLFRNNEMGNQLATQMSNLKERHLRQQRLKTAMTSRRN